MSKPTSTFYKSQSKTAGPPSQNSPRTFNFEKYQQSPPDNMEAGRPDLEFTSKLPAITDLINLKTKYSKSLLAFLIIFFKRFGSFNQQYYLESHKILTKP